MVRRLRCLLVIVAMVLAAVGCSRRPERLPEGVTVPALRGKQGAAGRVAGLAKGRDESFVPPAAAELDRLVWIDRPVKDGLAVLREELAAGDAGGFAQTLEKVEVFHVHESLEGGRPPEANAACEHELMGRECPRWRIDARAVTSVRRGRSGSDGRVKRPAAR